VQRTRSSSSDNGRVRSEAQRGTPGGLASTCVAQELAAAPAWLCLAGAAACLWHFFLACGAGGGAWVGLLKNEKRLGRVKNATAIRQTILAV
jgi:hypothetical protein